MQPFSFVVTSRDSKTNARTGVIHTPHGDIETPTFVPVGTQGTVKSLTPQEIADLRVSLFFVNTYHMYLRPGIEIIEEAGGLHSFIGWEKPLITDSGGFQVFSLGRKKSADTEAPTLVKISEDGVEFQSHWDGSRHMFTPESSMEWQWRMGSDIHIAFDDCTPYPVTHEEARTSMERTHRWAERSLIANEQWKARSQKIGTPYQALYGSIQGSVFEDLRKESAAYISAMDFDGIAIGGVSVGESKEEMARVLEWVMPILPDARPRHLLGVGEIDDIFTLVSAGIDTFDCVQPTRLARTGYLFVRGEGSEHKIDINKSKYKRDLGPIAAGCGCYTCQHFSRGYLHHLFHVRELLAYRLATIHNIYFMMSLVSDIRSAIRDGAFVDLQKAWG